MDTRAAIGGERALRRIIALLVALAALSERAAPRSAPVRWFVLWLLRRAETAAESFVLEATGLPPAANGIAAVGNGPADAHRLAARYHALAALLATLLPARRGFDRRPARHGPASGDVAPGSANLPGGWREKPNDTS